MATELIKEIHVKPDGVYLYSKSNNDDRPFRQWKCNSLTEVYQAEGQAGLDREMIRMFCEYSAIRGNHPSVTKYEPCLRDGKTIREAFIQSLNSKYEKLSAEDKAAIWLPEERQTAKAKAYRAFTREVENRLYEQLARLCLLSEENDDTPEYWAIEYEDNEQDDDLEI